MQERILKKTKEKLKQIAYTIVGNVLTAFAISTLLTPNQIVLGGVSGISTILYYVADMPLSVTFGAINIVLLLLGIWFLGLEFTVKTLVGAGILTFFVEIFSHVPSLTDNVFLATLFGGVLYGVGCAIAFVAGASTGGTDILSRIAQHFVKFLPIGKILLIINCVVILSSLLVFKDIELVMFGILALFVSSFSIDWVIQKLNISRIAFVITDKGEEVSKTLVSTSPRGVTMIKAVGAYSNERKKLLFCALKKNEVPDFQKKILDIDEDAFIVYSESSEIMGKGFRIYQ